MLLQMTWSRRANLSFVSGCQWRSFLKRPRLIHTLFIISLTLSNSSTTWKKFSQLQMGLFSIYVTRGNLDLNSTKRKTIECLQLSFSLPTSPPMGKWCHRPHWHPFGSDVRHRWWSVASLTAAGLIRNISHDLILDIEKIAQATKSTVSQTFKFSGVWSSIDPLNLNASQAQSKGPVSVWA